MFMINLCWYNFSVVGLKVIYTSYFDPLRIVPDVGDIIYLFSSFFLSYTRSARVLRTHTHGISLSLTKRMNIVLLYPQRTLPKSTDSSVIFSRVISGIVILDTSSRLYFAPFFSSMGTRHLFFPYFILFLAV